MKKNNILIVEDDPNLGKILQDYLKLKGYKITLAVDGEDGLSKFSKDNFDFIILCFKFLISAIFNLLKVHSETICFTAFTMSSFFPDSIAINKIFSSLTRNGR